MRTLELLQNNKPLQTLVRSAAITGGGILAALIVGFTGFLLYGRVHHAAWADAGTYTVSLGFGQTMTMQNPTAPDMSHMFDGTPLAAYNPNGPTPAANPAPTANPAPAPMPAANKLGLNDPPANVSPSSDFPRACYTMQQSQNCDNIALANINRARAAEGLGPMVLPDYYYSLPLDQQIMVVTNLERTDRGLSALKGPDQTLNSLAQSGAQSNADPAGPSNFNWASNWAGGEASALAMDYSLMYDDGLGSSNVDCSQQTLSGCWGHRHNILVDWPNATMGIGIAQVGGWISITQLIVQNW